MNDPIIGGLLIYISVMAKLHIAKSQPLSLISSILFITGWSIILRNLQFNVNSENSIFALQIIITSIIAGALLNRLHFDKGNKNPIPFAMILFLGGWLAFNIIYWIDSDVEIMKKILLSIGSMVTISGVMLNRQGELGNVNKLFGAIAFGLGWIIISQSF